VFGTVPVATYVAGWELPVGWKLDSAIRYACSEGLVGAFDRWSPSVILRRGPVLLRRRLRLAVVKDILPFQSGDLRIAMDLLPYSRLSERDSIAADAKHVFGMTPEERAAVFVDLERTMEAILADLPAEERRRRVEASRFLDPLPTPWWKNLRRSAWPREDAAS
jgi:hypothetical protein